MRYDRFYSANSFIFELIFCKQIMYFTQSTIAASSIVSISVSTITAESSIIYAVSKGEYEIGKAVRADFALTSEQNRKDLEFGYVKISINVLPEHLASLSLWAALQGDHPDQSEAIRRIIDGIELCAFDTLHHKKEESERVSKKLNRKHSL